MAETTATVSTSPSNQVELKQKPRTGEILSNASAQAEAPKPLVTPEVNQLADVAEAARLAEIDPGKALQDIADDVNSEMPRFDSGVKIDRNNKTALLIEEEINKSGGSIPYSKFMELSLFSDEGYYASGNVEIGYGGDFITSPEASEIFGATLGKTAMRVWEAMGKPETFRIVEMGAGKGALAYSLLRWTEKLYPEFHKAIKYTVLEYGAGLIPQQQTRLAGFDNIQWVRGSAYELPFRDVEGVFISNELPDAFPVEVVTLLNERVKQKGVMLENDTWVEAWEEPSTEVIEYISKYGIRLQEGVEEPINLQAVRLQRQLDQALKRGGIITIDYGKNGEVGEEGGDTLRFYSTKIKEANSEDPNEYRKAQYVNPGNSDITASINFRVLEQIANDEGLQTAFSGLQKELLLKTGVTEIIQGMKSEFSKLKSWKDVVALSRAFLGYSSIVHISDEETAGMGDFYSHLLLKGIEPASINWGSPSRTVHIESPRVPLSVGRANSRVELDFRDVPASEFFLDYKKDYVYTDNAGRIWLAPDFIEGLKVYDGNKEVVNFTDQEVLKQAVQKMGYTFE